MLTALNGIKMNIPTNNETYLLQLSKSKFCICPFGNGIDSHRVWEALYLGAIPVVPECSFFRSFTNLPIVYINDWSIVSPTFLNAEYNRLQSTIFNYEKLKLSFWKEKITGSD